MTTPEPPILHTPHTLDEAMQLIRNLESDNGTLRAHALGCEREARQRFNEADELRQLRKSDAVIIAELQRRLNQVEQERDTARADFQLAHEHLMTSEQRLMESYRQRDIQDAELTAVRRLLGVSRKAGAGAAEGPEPYAPAEYLQLMKTLTERGFTVTIDEFGVTVASAEDDFSFEHSAATLEGSLLGAARALRGWLAETADLISRALPKEPTS